MLTGLVAILRHDVRRRVGLPQDWSSFGCGWGACMKCKEPIVGRPRLSGSQPTGRQRHRLQIHDGHFQIPRSGMGMTGWTCRGIRPVD
jgi:hypothetical protein